MLDHRDLWRQNWTPMAGTTEGSICWTLLNISHQIWLVVSTPLKIISQLGWLFPIYGKKTCAKPPTRNYWATQFWPIPGTPLSTSRFRDGKRFSVLAILSLHHPLVQGDVEIGAPLNHPFIDRFSIINHAFWGTVPPFTEFLNAYRITIRRFTIH